MPPILILLLSVLINLCLSISIKLKSCNTQASNQLTIFLEGKNKIPYHPLSCKCLNIITICDNKLILQFDELNPQQLYHYQFSNPQIMEDIRNNQTTYIKSINLDFKTGESYQERIYFQYDNFNTNFNFIVKNQNKDSIIKHQHSFLLLTVLTGLATILLAKYIKIRRFEPITIRWYFIIFYWLFIGLLITLLKFQGIVFQYFQKILLASLMFFTNAFYLQQVFTALKIRFRIRHIYLKDILSCLISTVLIIIWLILPDNWILNDIFAMFMIGSALKIFKIGSIRTSLIFLLLVLFLDVIIEAIFYFTHQVFTQRLINKYPSPLELQIPTLSFIIQKRCSWVEISDLIFPGLLIAYCRRVDTSLNSSVYMLLSYFSVILAIGCQISIYYLTNNIQIRQSIISIPILLIVLLATSLRRGQFSVLWYGGFYDKIDQRISLEKRIQWDSLTENIDKGLLIN